MLSHFDYTSPPSLADCLAAMANPNAQIAPIAGGTNLVVDLRSGRAQPDSVINLWDLTDLAYIRQEGEQIAIGGRTTVTQLLKSELIAQTGQAITQAAELFASPLIRNRATVGGNLADASPAADLAPPLLALDAEVDLQSASGSRTVPLSEFFVGPRQTVRQPNELITEVRYPISSGSTQFIKLGQRLEDAISVVSVALSIEMDGNSCQSVRIGLGAVAPTPKRATNAEAILAGNVLTAELVQAAAEAAANQDASPIDDVRASAEYRRWMVEALVERALTAQMEAK